MVKVLRIGYAPWPAVRRTPAPDRDRRGGFAFAEVAGRCGDRGHRDRCVARGHRCHRVLASPGPTDESRRHPSSHRERSVTDRPTSVSGGCTRRDAGGRASVRADWAGPLCLASGDRGPLRGGAGQTTVGGAWLAGHRRRASSRTRASTCGEPVCGSPVSGSACGAKHVDRGLVRAQRRPGGQRGLHRLVEPGVFQPVRQPGAGLAHEPG
jgi:hypothetical protein